MYGRVIGYAYEADVHCTDCTLGTWGEVTEDTVDTDWNPVLPVLSGQDTNDLTDNMVCGDCLTVLYEAYVPEPSEPDEDDLTSSNGLDWYQYGKRVLSIPEDVDRDAKLSEFMGRTGFYPNCWIISDHGNPILLSIPQE